MRATVFWITQEHNELETCGFQQSREETRGIFFSNIVMDEIILESIIFANHSKKYIKTACCFDEFWFWHVIKREDLQIYSSKYNSNDYRECSNVKQTDSSSKNMNFSWFLSKFSYFFSKFYLSYKAFLYMFFIFCKNDWF